MTGVPAGPGIRLGGRYRLEDRVDAMAGASAWRATDEVLNRPVFARVLAPDRPVAVEVITAVLRAARLTDPRLARIFDADCRAGLPYIISEWPPGQCLEDLIAADLPRPEAAARIIWATAEALADAHRAGQPHLCLSPRSVSWSADGVKIAGLAVEAAIAGKTAADPAAADARGLAELLYALLTGYWPGDDVTALPPAPRHHGRPYRPQLVRAGVPARLDSVICRTLLPGPFSGNEIRAPAEFARALLNAVGGRRPSRGTRRPGPRPAGSCDGARITGTADLS